MVQRVSAVADLAEHTDAAATMRARGEAGDEESAWMAEQWSADRLLVAHVTVTVYAADERGAPVTAERVIEQAWLERDAPAAVEAQIADLAPAELPAIAGDLRAR